MNDVICVSHGKDADGLICAALLNNLKNAEEVAKLRGKSVDELLG